MKRIASVTLNVGVVPNRGGASPAHRLIVGLVTNIVPIRNDAFNLWTDVV